MMMRRDDLGQLQGWERCAAEPTFLELGWGGRFFPDPSVHAAILTEIYRCVACSSRDDNEEETPG
jgi:hypothetical protein